MALGVFDSGVGGLTVHRRLVDRFPDADLIYLADQAHAPYGVRAGEEIVDLTRAGCARLFDLGCALVVLACNTASAIALRRLQQTWLPEERRRRARALNVLGIIVPTIEAATGMDWQAEPERRGEKVERVEVIGVFSTAATTASRVFEIEIDKRREDIAVFSEACTGLAGLIEAGAPRDQLAEVVSGHCQILKSRIGRAPDKVILGCTHYEIVADLFADALPPSTPVIHQPDAVAASLEVYVARRPEYGIGSGGLRRFLTTGSPEAAATHANSFWGSPVPFSRS